MEIQIGSTVFSIPPLLKPGETINAKILANRRDLINLKSRIQKALDSGEDYCEVNLAEQGDAIGRELP